LQTGLCFNQPAFVPSCRYNIAEVYPTLFSKQFPRNPGLTQDQHDAFAVAAWLRREDRDGRVALHLTPPLSDSEKAIARVEGWILGVSGEVESATSAKRRKRKTNTNDNRRTSMTTPANSRLASAMTYAALIHGTQKRKGTSIPYVSHLMSVSALVMEYGGDEDQAIAGLLHDSLEDVGAEHEAVIRTNWGDRVADIVKNCTDGVADAKGEKADWHTRKRAYIAHLKHVGADTLLVSACDKLHNARAIVADLRAGNDVFSRFKAGREGTQWYYRELVAAFTERLGRDAPVVKELAAAVVELCAG
jgi:GTP pyrophosphokinase